MLARVSPPLDYGRMTQCRACPRLARHLDAVRRQHPDYHAAPVGPWGRPSSRLLIVGLAPGMHGANRTGRPSSRLLIVGLAPGMHGANRTGRPFTGDASGGFLFESLARAGFASAPDPNVATLQGVRITNAVRCLPPGNRPVAAEVARCRGYLNHELRELWWPQVRKPRCVLALGRIAHDAIGQALELDTVAFGHGVEQELLPGLLLLDTYHPSRQNTNTGRLTRRMLDAVVGRARLYLDSPRGSARPGATGA